MATEDTPTGHVGPDALLQRPLHEEDAAVRTEWLARLVLRDLEAATDVDARNRERLLAVSDAIEFTWRAMALLDPGAANAPTPLGERTRAIEWIARATARIVATAPTGGTWGLTFAASFTRLARAIERTRAEPLDRLCLATIPDRVAPLTVLVRCAFDAAGRQDLLPKSEPLLDSSFGVVESCTVQRRILADERSKIDDFVDPGARLDETELRDAANRCARAWRDLGFASVAAWLEEIPIEPARRRTGAVPHSERRIDEAIAAARTALDAAQELRESHEVYRWGFLESPKLVSSVFPEGTIVENRACAGDRVHDLVDDLFSRYRANRFHYFDAPSSLPFDVDTFGLMARLASHASDPRAARQSLERPLQWILATIEELDDVPVFLTKGVDAGDGRKYITTLGNSCSAVQASLFLGLAALGAACPADAIEFTGRRLCERFATEGCASLTHYEAPYGAWLVFQALGVMQEIAPRCSPFASAAKDVTISVLQRTSRFEYPNALELAWRCLCTHSTETRHFRDDTWIEALLRTQRIDGTWSAAPFYRVPSRGNFGEQHASRLVTTSFVMRALAGRG
jgi:hypothetical protein